MEAQIVGLTKLLNNSGQIAGVPKNPRFIKNKRFKKLVKSLKDDPEMLELRELIAISHKNKFVVICGNMRLRALKELNYQDAFVKVLPPDTAPEKLRAFAIKDNIEFGENDHDLLANDWDLEELTDWGMELNFQKEEIDFHEDEIDDQENELQNRGIETSKITFVLDSYNHQFVIDTLSKINENKEKALIKLCQDVN